MQNRASRSLSASLIPFLLLTFLLSSCLTGGQRDSELPKKTQEFLNSCNWDFGSLEPSRLEDIRDPNIHSRYYLVDGDVESVWSLYIGSDPAGQWQGPIANLAAVYDPESAHLHTSPLVSGLTYSEGQIYFLDLTIEWFYHVTAAFMISDIDPGRRILAFNYLDNNTSKGRQEITFTGLNNGGGNQTLIRHRSWYKSDSDFRDVLYGPYHEEALDEFHFNIIRGSGMSSRIMSRKKLEKKGAVS